MDEFIQPLLKTLPSNYSAHDIALIEKAYQFAAEAHTGQIRLNGAPFITHSAGTAELLAQWRLPPEIIASGLLHDVPEDTQFTLSDIKKQFSDDIAAIVEG